MSNKKMNAGILAKVLSKLPKTTPLGIAKLANGEMFIYAKLTKGDKQSA